MIAVDTNLLVYAHRSDSRWHGAAKQRIRELAEGCELWAIPWPCIHEFLAVITHPRIFVPPTTLTTAIGQIELWRQSPSIVLLSEREGYWESLSAILKEGQVLGPQVHDARIAALCIHHRVQELWTVDRDFSRFPGLKVRNPLVESV
jgi:toxin-antitoxin system PIN domain toxin